MFDNVEIVKYLLHYIQRYTTPTLFIIVMYNMAEQEVTTEKLITSKNGVW